MTGATGAIGSALVPVLLAESDAAVRLLLRADSAEHLRERLRTLFAFWGTDEAASGRVTAVRGDVGQERLGLEADVFERLTGEVTHIIHSAGNVRLNRSLDEACHDAVDPARHIVSFARAAPSFQKLDFVSTVGVAGRTPGRVPETPIAAPPGFHNTYEEAKWEAEQFLFAEMQKGLSATVHRPSMVVGDSRTGRIIHFQVFYYLAEFLTGTRTWGIVPRTGNVRLDIIPADYVAACLAVASRSPETAGRVFHLCSGPELSPQLADLTAQLRALFLRAGCRLPRLRRLPPGAIGAFVRLAPLLIPKRFHKRLQTLPYFLAYLAEEQVFENAATRAFFQEKGVDVPRVETYLGTLMDAYFAGLDGPLVRAKGS